MSYHLIRISREKIPVFKWATTNPTDKEASSTSFGQPRGGARPKGGGRPISFHSMDRNQLQSLASGSDSIQVVRETRLMGRECWLARLLRWRMLVGSFAEVEDADWLVCCGRRMLIGSSATGRECWLARLPGGGWCWLARLPGRRMLIGWLEEVVNYDWRI